MTLREYQQRAADMIVRNGATYLMHDMGMGKTLTCITAMKKVGLPVIVLAPLNAILNTWPDELTKWAPDLSYVILHGPYKNSLAAQARNYDVLLLNFEGLQWWYEMVMSKRFKLKKFFVIWDEASFLKDYTTKRWEILVEAMPIWSSYRVCLSGTPMPNTMLDLWAQYYLLDKGKRLSPSFYSFRSTHFNYSGPPRYITTLKPFADTLIYDRIADITDRLDSKDYLELPEEVHNDVYLELPAKLRNLYTEFEKEFMLVFKDGVSEANSAAVLTCKLRQFLQGAVYYQKEGVQYDTPIREAQIFHNIKAEVLKQLVEGLAGQPVLVPIQFIFEYKILCETFKKKSIPIISGRTSPKDTRQLITKWNNGSLPILLCHPKSVALSLNLQFGGYNIIWMALPWEMDLYKQLIRRIRRSGQKSNRVVVSRLIFKDTIDETIAKVLAKKESTQQALFNALQNKK
jgi:SNF2 family DNA or RNA helicase